MLILMAAEVSFSILDISSFLSLAHVPGKLPEMSHKFQQVYQFLIIRMRLLLSNTFSLSLSSGFGGFLVQLHFKNPRCAGCEKREKRLFKVLLTLSQILKPKKKKKVVNIQNFQVFYQNNASKEAHFCGRLIFISYILLSLQMKNKFVNNRILMLTYSLSYTLGASVLISFLTSI